MVNRIVVFQFPVGAEWVLSPILEKRCLVTKFEGLVEGDWRLRLDLPRIARSEGRVGDWVLSKWASP